MCLSNVGDDTTTNSGRTVRSGTDLRRRRPGHREGPIRPPLHRGHSRIGPSLQRCPVYLKKWYRSWGQGQWGAGSMRDHLILYGTELES